MSGVRIGIDFDNTIICYDKVFSAAAQQRGLIRDGWAAAKSEIRDYLRSQPGGEVAWQGLQGWVYGKGIRDAEIFSGVRDFLAACRLANASVYIVSHKTRHGHQDPDRTDLREAARGWMRSAGLLDAPDSPLTADKFISKAPLPPRSTGSRNSNSISSSTISSTSSSSRTSPNKQSRSCLAAPTPASNPAQPGPTFGTRSSRHERGGVRHRTRDRDRQPPRRTAGARGHTRPARRQQPGVPPRHGRWLAARPQILPSQAVDRRDRLGQEYEALSFLAQHGVGSTPRPYANDRDENCALYEWFDGEAAVLQPRPDDVDRLADFLVELQKLRDAAGARPCVTRRRAFFRRRRPSHNANSACNRLLEQASGDPDLRAFVDRDLAPSAALARRRVEERYAKLGLDPAAGLTLAQRALSPSDFGLHNAMRDDGRAIALHRFRVFRLGRSGQTGVGYRAASRQRLSRKHGAKRLMARLSHEFEARDAGVCGPPGRAVSCFRADLVPDHPERISAGKPIPACHGRTRRRSGGHSGRPARQGSAAPSSDLPN